MSRDHPKSDYALGVEVGSTMHDQDEHGALVAQLFKERDELRAKLAAAEQVVTRFRLEHAGKQCMEVLAERDEALAKLAAAEAAYEQQRGWLITSQMERNLTQKEADGLRAKLAAAEANDKTSQDCAQKYLAERDDARAQVEELYKTDGWSEVRRLRAKLAAAEARGVASPSGAYAHYIDRITEVKRERDDLRAQLSESERQKHVVAVWNNEAVDQRDEARALADRLANALTLERADKSRLGAGPLLWESDAALAEWEAQRR